MKHLVFIALLLFSLPLAAKKAPKWKDGNFKSTASGLQYKIVKEGKGDSIRLNDLVLLELYVYNPDDHLLIKYQKDMKDGQMFPVYESELSRGLIQSIRTLKKGGKGYFMIPPSLGKAGTKDTFYCFIAIRNVFRQMRDEDAHVIGPVIDTITIDSVNILIHDPSKKYFGDTLFSVMKLVEAPQLVSCGMTKVLIAFKFELTYFENGMQRKSLLVFIECPDSYGKDYFVAGTSYVVTCVPLMDDLKDGSRTMNAYSLEKLDKYYGLRVRKM